MFYIVVAISLCLVLRVFECVLRERKKLLHNEEGKWSVQRISGIDSCGESSGVRHDISPYKEG